MKQISFFPLFKPLSAGGEIFYMEMTGKMAITIDGNKKAPKASYSISKYPKGTRSSAIFVGPSTTMLMKNTLDAASKITR